MTLETADMGSLGSFFSENENLYSLSSYVASGNRKWLAEFRYTARNARAGVQRSAVSKSQRHGPLRDKARREKPHVIDYERLKSSSTLTISSSPK